MITTIINITITGIGIFNTYPCPKLTMDSGRSYTGRPPDIIYASPRTTVIMPSVITIADTFRPTIRHPVTHPMSVISNTVSKSATGIGMPASPINFAAITPVRPRYAPTVKSMPPDIITKVMPQVKIPSTEICRKIFRILFTFRKFSDETENRTNNTSSIINVLNFFNSCFIVLLLI